MQDADSELAAGELSAGFLIIHPIRCLRTCVQPSQRPRRFSMDPYMAYKPSNAGSLGAIMPERSYELHLD